MHRVSSSAADGQVRPCPATTAGEPASIEGTVQSIDREPIRGASFQIDDQVVTSDRLGRFTVLNIRAGVAFVRIGAAGSTPTDPGRSTAPGLQRIPGPCRRSGLHSGLCENSRSPAWPELLKRSRWTGAAKSARATARGHSSGRDYLRKAIHDLALDVHQPRARPAEGDADRRLKSEEQADTSEDEEKSRTGYGELRCRNPRCAPSSFEKIFQNEDRVGGAFGEAAHQIRIPLRSKRDVDAHAPSVANELLLQIAADSVEHLKLE